MKQEILTTTLLNHQIALFYLGQEGFLIKYRERYILIDGYLTDYVDRNSTDAVTWKRNYDAPITPEELDFVDYVLCTHPHGDHADPDTLKGIYQVNPNAVYLVPYVLKPELIGLGIPEDRIVCMDDGSVFESDDVSISSIPSAHEELEMDQNGHYVALGYLLRLGDTTLYHSGDCCIYDGLKERLTGIQIGLLPINGRDYYRNEKTIIGNMDSVEAIHLAKETKMEFLIPMHYDLYEINGVNPAFFVDNLYRINPTQKFHMFVPGERLIYDAH